MVDSEQQTVRLDRHSKFRLTCLNHSIDSVGSLAIINANRLTYRRYEMVNRMLFGRKESEAIRQLSLIRPWHCLKWKLVVCETQRFNIPPPVKEKRRFFVPQILATNRRPRFASNMDLYRFAEHEYGTDDGLYEAPWLYCIESYCVLVNNKDHSRTYKKTLLIDLAMGRTMYVSIDQEIYSNRLHWEFRPRPRLQLIHFSRTPKDRNNGPPLIARRRHCISCLNE